MSNGFGTRAALALATRAFSTRLARSTRSMSRDRSTSGRDGFACIAERSAQHRERAGQDEQRCRGNESDQSNDRTGADEPHRRSRQYASHACGRYFREAAWAEAPRRSGHALGPVLRNTLGRCLQGARGGAQGERSQCTARCDARGIDRFSADPRPIVPPERARPSVASPARRHPRRRRRRRGSRSCRALV